MSDEKAKGKVRSLLEDEGEGLARLLFLLVPDPLDAEDLFQNYFTARRGMSQRAVRTDAYRQVYALARRSLRRQQSVPYRPVELGEETSPGFRRIEPLRRAWYRLPFVERGSVLLLIGAGFSIEETAKTIGLSPTSAWAKAERGLLLLQKEIDGRSRHAGTPSGTKHGETLAQALTGAPKTDEGGRRIDVDLAAAQRSFRLLFEGGLRAAVWRKVYRRVLRELPDHEGILLYDQFDTPLGPFQVVALEGVVVGTAFGRRSEASWRRAFAGAGISDVRRDPESLSGPRRELEAYFGGTGRSFRFPYRLVGVSSFQASVLDACSRVGFGRVQSYKQIAEAVGRPSANRAVGRALGRNPLPVVIPCHRIISYDGRLGGYSAGHGLKEKLLALEGMPPLFPSAIPLERGGSGG